ncbi:hypothetical protein PINS_up022797 [Pythium insidiosum]|nr:hypothetical protein PINS_up022797 [Pythium insidiosum]
MRSVSLLLAALLAVGSRAAAAPTDTVSALTAQEIAALQAELKAWKDSPAGQTAARLGFLPTNAAPASSHGARRLSEDPVIDNQLQRLVASKKRMAEIQARQPKAILSMDTPLALMTPDEFELFATGGRSGNPQHRQLQAVNVSSSIDATAQRVHERVLQSAPTRPKEVDWQKEGCVTPIKNQGQCGVCWAFATVGSLETAACVHSPDKTLIELSEQDLLSCSTAAGRCWGGFSRDGYDWIAHKNGGTVCTAASMPFVAVDKVVTCPNPDPVARCERPKIDIVSYVNMDYPNHEDLETVIATRGAVAAALTSNAPIFQFYRGGLLMGDKDACPSGTIHEVVIVGYGERDGVKYWKVKNQWDTWWGDQGYAYLERGYQGEPYGTCGIEGWSNYPIFRDEVKFGLDRTCQSVQDGVELLGKDLKVVRVFEPSKQCCDICRFEPGCVGATFHPDSTARSCVLKATIEGTRPYPDGRGGHFVMDGNTPPATPLPTQTATSQPTPVDPKQCPNVQENIDLPGNDLANSKADTVGDCCKLCSQTSKCVAYTWSRYNGGMCYMKHTKTARPVYSAPQPDGTPYLVSGEVAKPVDQSKCLPVQDNLDYPGNDLSNVKAATVGDCCQACTTTPQCEAYTWSRYNGGTCFMKHTKSARPVYSSPSADGSPYLVSGEVYRCEALQKDVDLPGEDLANVPGLRAEDCCAKCRKTNGCAAFSWSDYNGGTCWMKRKAVAGVTRNGVTSAVAK